MHVQKCHYFRQKYTLYETFSLDPCLRVPALCVCLRAEQLMTHIGLKFLRGIIYSLHFSFWLLHLKCQQHHGLWFMATLQCACSFLSYIEDCNYNAVEPSSCKYSVNISLILGSEIFLCGSFYKKCHNY